MSTSKKKELGKYYTPPHLSDALCRLAIGDSKTDVLEPSFGGCAFLTSIKKRLKELGTSNPEQQIFGCDIDEEAFDHLSHWGVNGTLDHFHKKDFLLLEPSEVSSKKFDVVIGNPPYISIHNMGNSQKEVVKSFREEKNLPFENRASLWAYFVIHSCSFLKKGGSICFVLPQIAMHTFYGEKTISLIKKRFNTVHWYTISNRHFEHEGIDEKVGILYAKNYEPEADYKKNDIKVFSIDHNDFEKIERVQEREDAPTDIRINKISLKELYPEVDLIKLGELIDIKIGAVTGDNNYFVINESTRTENNLKEDYFIPIVRKFTHCGIFNFTRSDWEQLVSKNERVFLFYPNSIDTSDPHLQKYLNSYPEDKKDRNRTFAKRSSWWQVDIDSNPDAFFPYMNQSGPSLVLNSGNAQCTNNIHKIFFKNNVSEFQKNLMCIALNTTIANLSGELEGRVYSSGVLKFEPSAVKKICIPNILKIQETDIILEQVNDIIGADFSNSDELQRRADVFFSNFDLFQIGENETAKKFLNEMRQKR